MASKMFLQETKRAFKGSMTEPGKYWKLFDANQEADNIYQFCMKLFDTLTNPSKDTFSDQEHEAMYSTLLMLQFYKNTKNKSQKWLNDTHQLREQNNRKQYQHAKWVVKLFISNSEESQFAINFISSVSHVPEKWDMKIQPGIQLLQALNEASQYYDILQHKKKDKTYKKLANLSFPVFLKESKIAAFSYCCFLDYLKSCGQHPKKKIWLHVLQNLRGMAHAVRFTIKAQPLLTPLLFLISSLIKFNGCSYKDVLKEMIYLVHSLRNCAGTNGHLASDLFDMLHMELKFPGSAFRKEIKKRFVNIDCKKSEQMGSPKYCLSFRKIDARDDFCSINTLRKLMIYNVMSCCSGLEFQKYLGSVELLDLGTCYNLFYKMMKIIDISTNIQTYQSIQKLVRQSLKDLMDQKWIPFHKINKNEINQIIQLTPKQHPNKFFQFPHFRLVHVRPENLLNEQAENSLFQLFQDIKKQPFNQFFFSKTLQFILIGHDEEISRILKKICDFLLDVPPKEMQKISFYLVPVRDGECALARYLAYKDIWYRRYVYNVFRERTIFPGISHDDPEIGDSFPAYLFNKTIQMYIRQAERKVPIQIFSCEYTLVGKIESQTLYFMNSVLLGASFECQILKTELKQQKKYQQLDGIDIYLQKIKRLPLISVSVTVQYIQPGTSSLISKQQKFASIEDIQICNTPRPYFFGHKPDPLSENIEVSILTTEAAKTFRSQLQNKENIKRYSQQQVQQAFKDLFIKMTVQSIVVEKTQMMRQTNLKLLVDGFSIVDVQRFKISPVYTNASNGKLPLTMPLRCFLPFTA